MFIANAVLIALASLGLMPQIQPPSLPQPSPSQAQIQACLAALPAAPKPPRPAVNLFPGLQQKLDDMIRKAGGDPVAMRTAAAQEAAQKYAEAQAAYALKRNSCYTAAPLPVTTAVPPVIAPQSGLPATAPVPSPQPK